MVKSVSSGLDTHLQSDVTTLATGWKITRVDGTVFRFTSNAEDVDIDIGDGDGEQTYKASEGYNRTAVEGDADLNVSNMNIVGVFDDAEITETDLKRGLFDFAEVRVFIFNHQDTSQGVLKQLRGFLGEVMVTTRGFFNVELRDLVQVYAQKLGEHYSKDCRADLGDRRCRLPLYPDVLGRRQSVQVGEYYRVRTNPAPDDFGCRVLILPFDGADAATSTTDFSRLSNAINFFGGAQLDTAQSKFGGASLLLDGTGDYLEVPDRDEFTPFAQEAFTVHCWVRPALAGAGTVRTIASQWRGDGSNDLRSWRLHINADETVEFRWSTDGGPVGGNIITSTATLAADTWAHVAVTRDASGNIRLFVGGTLEATSASPDTAALFNSPQPFRVGAVHDGGSVTQFMHGHVDEMEFVMGDALWTSGFTPPTSGLTTTDPGEPDPVTHDMFEDRMYRVTQAGTTSFCQPTYDTVVTNTTNDGTAVLVAVHSWTREAEVATVVDSRRIFKVTELTPNSGHAVDDMEPTAVGFPDDFFNHGAAVFETGGNAGIAMEIRDFVADDGVTIEQQIELFTDLPFDIQVGDKLRVQVGCDKVFATCRDKFDNVLNFVGEPHVPGNDMLGQYPDSRA